MNRNLIILSLLIFILIPFSSSASDFSYNRLYDNEQPSGRLNDLSDVSITNATTLQLLLYNQSSDLWYNSYLNDSVHSVNASNYWLTDKGALNNPSDIQHNWLSNLLWSVAGHVMDTFLDMSGNSIENVSHLQFDITGDGCTDEGCMEWNVEDGTLNLRMPGGNVNGQILQETLSRVTNAEGETIFNCQAVFISGATGSNLEVQTPIASNVMEAPLTVGLATEDILDNQRGYITIIGKVRGCDTSAWAAGDILYLSATEEGNLTNVKPESPNTGVIIGVVERSNVNEGIISTKPIVLQRLVTHSDIYPNALTNNSIVQYVASNGRFEMTTNPFFNNVTVLDDIDMTNGSVLNLWEMVSTDGSRIATGANPAYSSFSGLDSAEIFSSNQSVGAGVITHALLSTDTGNEKVLAAWQSGKNNSGQYTRNSMGVFPDLGLLDVSILTNIEEMWTRFGINPFADYFSAENKTSIASLWAFESQKLFLHDDLGNGQLFGEGDFTWIARLGVDIDLYNGNGVHIQKEEVKEFGFNAGDNITSLNANFDSGVLAPFVRTTTGGILTDWHASADALCHDGDCAKALGGSGSPLRSMQTNFSSIDQDNLNLSWWLTTIQSSPDIFTVQVNNNIGSGDITVFTSSATFSDEYKSVILPSSMNNKSTVTVIFNFQGNNPSQDVAYVDGILVVGNATTTTLANVTVFDANLEFGDKTCGIELSSEDGYQDLNITCDNINLIGNVTSTDITEVTINITDSINVQNNVTLGSGATFWSNATCAFISSPAGTTVLEVCD